MLEGGPQSAGPAVGTGRSFHAVPQEFIVEEQGGIDDPLGMLGTRVEGHGPSRDRERHPARARC